VSLIETAIRNAKKLAAAARAEEEMPEPAPLRPRKPQRERIRVATPVEPGRSFRQAMVDPAPMERRGVLLQIHDETAERSYKILRTRIQQRMEASLWHSIAITAAAAGDGKTLTSINLAIALARDPNTWVFLVDLDLQRPQIAPYLGMRFDKGLSDYLAGQANFEDIVYEPGVERLAVIPNGKALEHSSELLGSPRMFELSQALASEAPRRIVIFDMPPLLLSDDVLRFMPNVDCLLMVISEGKTPRAAVQHARESIPEKKLLGVVLNRSAEREESAYY
jgi:capsular exopolysaccharide synthesis family protein